MNVQRGLAGKAAGLTVFAWREHVPGGSCLHISKSYGLPCFKHGGIEKHVQW